MVQYVHFRILEFPLISSCLFYLLGVAICTYHRFEHQVLNRQKAEFPSRIAPWNFKGCHVPGKTLELSWECPYHHCFPFENSIAMQFSSVFSMLIIIRIIITTTIIITIFRHPYTSINTCCLFVYLFIHWFIRSFIHSSFLSFIHSCIYLCSHLLCRYLFMRIYILCINKCVYICIYCGRISV